MEQYKFRILLVEHRKDWQDILREKINEALQKIPCSNELRLVVNFNAARNVLANEGPWDLLVTDISLGTHGMPGNMLVEKATDLAIPCIVVTGKATKPNHLRHFFKDLKIYDYFSKGDFDSKKFIEAIQKILQGKEKILQDKQGLDIGAQQNINKITWLHLSDLHFHKSRTYNSNIVLNALLQDIEELKRKPGLLADFIVISGDIAYASDPKEYDLAQQFFNDLLTVTGLHKDRLFVVPGNHDVNRSAISPFAASAPIVLCNRDTVNNTLANESERALLFQRFHHFYDFFRKYLGEKNVGVTSYVYVKSIKLVDLNIAIMGLNTAWLASGDNDQNRLLLGERQVRDALDAAKDADLRIAVMHHPFDWLQEFDRRDVEPLLYRECDFVLHGHLHQVGLLQASTPDTEAMIIAAGACYETRQHPNSYNVVQLDFAASRGTVYLRQYSDQQGGFWTKDVVNYRNINDGEYSFSLKQYKH